LTEIRFDLSRNIHQTAKESGVPSFAADKIAGLEEGN
jgi:hypothetical protein